MADLQIPRIAAGVFEDAAVESCEPWLQGNITRPRRAEYRAVREQFDESEPSAEGRIEQRNRAVGGVHRSNEEQVCWHGEVSAG